MIYKYSGFAGTLPLRRILQFLVSDYVFLDWQGTVRINIQYVLVYSILNVAGPTAIASGYKNVSDASCVVIWLLEITSKIRFSLRFAAAGIRQLKTTLLRVTIVSTSQEPKRRRTETRRSLLTFAAGMRDSSRIQEQERPLQLYAVRASNFSFFKCLNMYIRLAIRTPFYIRFRSDSYEFTGAAADMLEATKADRGFQLNYFMDSTNC